MSGFSRWLLACSALVGAVLGVLFVLLSRQDESPCTTLDDGTRACMPVMVIPPPLWVYVAFGITGAVLGVLVTWLVVSLRRRSTS